MLDTEGIFCLALLKITHFLICCTWMNETQSLPSSNPKSRDRKWGVRSRTEKARKTVPSLRCCRDLGLKWYELWTFPTMDPPGSLRLEFTHCLTWVSIDACKNLILGLCIWVLWGCYLGAGIFTSPSRYSQSISSCVLASALRAYYKSEAPEPDGPKHSLTHFKDILVSICLGMVK